MKKNCIIQIICLLFVSFVVNPAYSQNRKTITGKVIDANDKQALPGAAIQIENSSQGLVTGLDGSFTLENIRESSVTLVVTYISYETQKIDIDFGNRSTRDITIQLKPSTTDLDEVVVTSDAEGQVKAMLDQKVAVNIKNIVSAEQIQQFPDMNAAEVLQRIPGITLQRDQGEGRFVQLRGTPPELTNFNVNGEQIPSPEGNVRYVGLDVISADQIDFIEVTKVLTPDMDADGIGGTVNIITKTAKSEKPDIRASLAGGYNNLRQTENYQLQFSYGQRYKKFGFNMNASQYVNNQGSDNMEFKYEKGTFYGSQEEGINNYHVQYREIQLRHYDITRARTGLSATLDYEFDPNNKLYLRGMYNQFSDYEIRRRVSYELDDAVTEKSYLYGGIDRDVREREKIQGINSVNLGGENRIFGIKLDYEVAYAFATESVPDRKEVLFDNPGQAIFMKFDLSDKDWPRLILPRAIDSVNAYNFAGYEFKELLLQNSIIEDENITAKLNFQIPYTLGRHPGYFKFGGKARLKDKRRDVNAREISAYFTTSRTYPGEGPELNFLDVADNFESANLLNKGYSVNYIPSAEKMYEFYDYYQQFFIIDRTGTKFKTYGEDYQANEDIYSLYGMFRQDFDDLMILGGLRYERTDIMYEGLRVLTDFRGNFEDVDTLTDTRRHEFILPQFQARYRLTPNFNLRAALTYTYSRPNFEDVLPYRQEDRDEVKYGNPDLKYPGSMNIDLLAERYLPGGGIFSGGLFYKKIEDFVFYYKRFAFEGDPGIGNFSRHEIEQAFNGNRAYVYGAELVSQFGMPFLPGFLSNLGLYLNYTYTYSEAFVNKRYPANEIVGVLIFGEDNTGAFSSGEEEEKLTLPGQAKHTANLAIYYEGERFYTKLTANFHDAFLYSLGVDPDLDEYYDKAWHLDFTANYQITDYLNVFADIVNLTNAPLKFYLGTPDRVLQQEYYSWWGRLGIKLKF